MEQMYYTLNNGVKIPSLGFGTWRIPDGEETYNAVLNALKVGYLHIDSALVYKNETSTGRAIKDSGVARKDIFLVTKLPADIKGYDKALETFNQQLKNLQVNYVDLYLIHGVKAWGDITDEMSLIDINVETWRALEKLYKEGKIKALGVSNFNPQTLTALMSKVEIKPSINQILVHPYHIPAENLAFCKKHNILIQAYSPLATGAITDDSKFAKIAKKYNKSIAQVILRWHLQNGFIPLPRSTKAERIAENFNVFDFELKNDEMKKIGKVE
jgi:diketogulonate reductase-like aldo/keto reductase